MNGQVHKKVRRAVIQSIVDECQATSQGHEFLLDNSENEISLPPGHSELISQLDGFEHLLSRPLSPEEADHKRFAEALKLFSPDDRRGNGTITGQGEDYLGVVFAGASIGAHDVVKEWAMRSDKFEEAEFESSYRSWGKTDNPVTVRSLYYHLSNRQSNASSTPGGPLEKLRAMSATGSSREMRNKMLTDVFVMKGICIQGQWTVIYAPPNSGKTLIVIWLLFEQVKAGLIQGRNVFYVNADDTYKGGVEKTELAEIYDVKMLIPAWRGFDIGQVTSLMQQLAETGQALGIVIVLDTLKKFTDLMDKRAASEFGKIARAFVSAGGTLIALAHTNKHKDSEGKGIYSGTSDIVDDCDCAFMIDKIDNSQQGAKGVHTVEFTNKKARGDVESTVAFRFERCPGQTYEELLESIERISGDTLDSARKHAELVKQLEDDDEVIHALSTVINSTNLNKVELIKSVNTDYGFSHKRIRQVLKRHTGNNYCDGARWKETRAQNNRVTYELVDPLKAV